MDNNSQSPGICQRLFRLVLGGLRLPSTALPPPPPRLINGDHSIAVELRHHRTDHSAKGARINSSDYQTKRPQNDTDEREMEKKEHQGKKQKHVSIMNMKGSERNVEGRERKEVTIHDAETISAEDTKLRRHWPLLSVASNINEKSAAFIERKKKAMMGRNYSLDQDHKKE